jgi:signal peptidase II
MEFQDRTLHYLMMHAKGALKRGDSQEARRWAEVAAEFAPDCEEPWLILAATAQPRASLAYFERALVVNPNSRRARRGRHWAIQQFRREQPNSPPRPRLMRRATTNIWFLPGFIFASAIVVLDIGSKWFARAILRPGETWVPLPDLGDSLLVVHLRNTGMALGLLQGYSLAFIPLTAAVIVIILAIFVFVPLRKWEQVLGLCLLFAGASGNLLDRLLTGYVTDIISIGRLPVFNLADLSILAGILFIAMGTLTDARRPTL